MILFASAAVGAGLVLTACDNGPSAVRTRDRAEASATAVDAPHGRQDEAAEASAPGRRSRYVERSSSRTDLGGGLVWASSRKYSGDDNAHYQFEHHGAEFGISDMKAFIAKADAFTAHPPEGVMKFERASNGDVILYDPKSNIFAVATKDGAPRTLTKKPDGLAYWEAQKAQESAREERGRGGGGGGSDRSS
jgi:pyocin large subunit-like protein